MRVLMLDDDPEDHQLVSEMLAEYDIAVAWADSLEQALAAIESGHWHAVLVDHRLGAESGLDLLSHPVFQQNAIPAIVLTGFGSDELDNDAFELGAAAFLSKNEINGPLLARTLRYATRAPAVRQARPAAMTAKEIKLQVGLASGLTVKEAAETSGISLRTAYRRIAMPEFQASLERIQEELATRLVEKAIDDLLA